MFKLLRKLNLPTKITLARIALLPLILFFYISGFCFDVVFFENWGKLIALILFIIAAGTDWVDGFIARKYNMVTDLGKFLDPAADKMLTNLGFLLILSDIVLFNEIAFPYWFAVVSIFVIFSRDTITDSLRFIAAKQDIVIAASSLGKIKTTMQLVAIALYMLFAFNLNPATAFITGAPWLDIFTYLCLFIMVAATVLTVWSGTDYVRNYMKSLKEKNATKEENKENGNGTKDNGEK